MAKVDFTGELFLNDTFTESSDVGNITDHTPDTDYHAYGYSSNANIDVIASTDVATNSVTGNQNFTYNGALKEHHLYIDAVVRTVGTSAANDKISVYMLDGDASEGYYWILDGTGALVLIRRSTTTTLGSYTITSFDAATFYTIRLELKSGSQKVFVDDVERISATDTTDDVSGLDTILINFKDANSELTSIEAKYLSWAPVELSGTRTFKWNMRDTISLTRTFKWNMRAYAPGARTFKWNILNQTTGTRTFLWNLIWLATTGQRAFKWNILNQTTGARTFKWTLYQLASGARTFKWHIRIENITGYRTFKWAIEALNVFFSVTPVDSGTTVYYAVIDRNGVVQQDFTNVGITEINPKTDLTIPGAVTLSENYSAYGVVIQMSAGFQGHVIFLVQFAGKYTTAWEQINGYINSLPAIKEQTDKMQFTGNGRIFSSTRDISTDAVTQIMSRVIETNGSITLQQAQSILLAAVAGEYDHNTGTFKDPSGTSTRITGTATNKGDRSSITLTPSS